MAAASSRPTKQPVKTGRVVKRPARGFHRFRNGIMNVMPKGGEKELYVLPATCEPHQLVLRVKNNQNSLLLKLPAEL